MEIDTLRENIHKILCDQQMQFQEAFALPDSLTSSREVRFCSRFDVCSLYICLPCCTVTSPLASFSVFLFVLVYSLIFVFFLLLTCHLYTQVLLLVREKTDLQSSICPSLTLPTSILCTDFLT